MSTDSEVPDGTAPSGRSTFDHASCSVAESFFWATDYDAGEYDYIQVCEHGVELMRVSP